VRKRNRIKGNREIERRRNRVKIDRETERKRNRDREKKKQTG
jgi:hypothetical protein